MPRVLISCPNSGKPVYTGVSLDRAEFDRAEIGTQRVVCPACGETHAWQKADARLESDQEAHEP